MTLRKRSKTGRMTRVVLLVSFIILAGRLIFVIPGAIKHHQQQQATSEQQQSIPLPVLSSEG